MSFEEEKSLQEQRRFRREFVPEGTTAHFSYNTHFQDFAYVLNISENGMLICDHFPRKRYQPGLLFNNIFIYISGKEDRLGHKPDSSFNFIIESAEVVRYSPGHLPYTSFYGVSFTDENRAAKEIISAYIKEESSAS